MRRLIANISGFLALLVTLAGCTHKELCYHHPHTAKVRIDADWSGFEKDDPTGMTVMVYPTDGGRPVRHLTNTISHAYLDLPAGTYNTVVFNQSEYEFGSLFFRGMDSYGTSEVCVNSTKSTWYKTKADTEKVASEPEWVGTDRQEGAEVTEEMIVGTGAYNIQTLQLQSRAPAAEYVIARHEPKNIIYTLNITVHVKGFHNLRSARASMTGLSEGYFFGQGRYSEAVVTQLLEDWRAETDKEDPTKGTLKTSMTCFGLPHGHRGTAAENIFGISILLVDNKTVKDFTFEVGDDFIHDYDETGVRLSLNLNLELWIDEPLPDVMPEHGSSSGFDARVEDWGEEIDYEIGI